MPLINCKVELSLTWNYYVLSSGENINNVEAVANPGTAATFKITVAKLYVPVVTLSTKDSVKLSKLLSEGFKRPVYWNKYKVIDNKIIEITDDNAAKHVRELLDSSSEGVRKLFILVYNIAVGDNQVSVDSHQKYLLPRVKIENYNIEIDGRNFYDQPVNDSIKQYDKVRKISTGQGDDCATGCLSDFGYFEKNYRLIAADLSKQKALDADSRAIQQIFFTGEIKSTVANTRVIIY